MEKNTVSLKWSRGQVLLEGLFFICMLLAFLVTVNIFQKYAQKEIKKERLIRYNKKDSNFKPRWIFK